MKKKHYEYRLDITNGITSNHLRIDYYTYAIATTYNLILNKFEKKHHLADKSWWPFLSFNSFEQKWSNISHSKLGTHLTAYPIHYFRNEDELKEWFGEHYKLLIIDLLVK